MTPKELFEKKIEPYIERIPFSGCWVFPKAMDSDGYGHVLDSEWKNRKTHRVSYEAHYGSIPKGKFVLHKCDVRCCCNPEHLRIGTARDNSQDMASKKRGKGGVTKLTEETVREIRKALKAKLLSQIDIAKKYGVTRQMLYYIQTYQVWKGV